MKYTVKQFGDAYTKSGISTMNVMKNSDGNTKMKIEKN